MELKRYTHKPTEVTGVEFDGSLSSAKYIQAWVQAGSGMLPVINVTPGGKYAIYVPTSSGTVLMGTGDILVQSDPTTYYPITPDDLAASYDEQGDDNGDSEPIPATA